ncbi:MAG: alcohol dehydrogenase [Dehalococcoidia bacterium]|nr:alcohol dehydrogenase [Dehalococcoidia bacterium]MSQ16957.1 alcohol dehydrogenase [Dehalococcoidia bacterium]
MKAVYIAKHGGPEVLTYGDRPNPEVAPGEIMLRVRASALNRLDLNLRDGKNYRGALPRVMGCDIAGEVVTISPNAHTDLKVGDRVILDNRTKCGVCESCRMGLDQNCTNGKRLGVDLDGGHAEYVTAPAANAHKFPQTMSFTEAAALPIVAHTAWHCLITQAQIRPWDDVLIQAAGSGVGSMGIQIAKMMGCRVITTAGSDWKLLKAKELGAYEGINYRTTPDLSKRVLELTGGKGVDVVFDCVGADVWEHNLKSLKPGGRLVITGVTSGTKASMDLSLLQGRPLHLMGSGGRSRRTFADMMKMVRQGSLHGVVDRVFPLDSVAEAHKVLESREYFGKLVVES